MTITIENPTAETLYLALQAVPPHELARLGALIMQKNPVIDDRTEWSEEDLHDLDRATARLIDERFGPEEGDYD